MEEVFWAIQANDTQKLRALVRQGADINAHRASDKLTPLVAAIAYRDMTQSVKTETIAVLLELGARPNEQFKLKGTRTPLYEACLKGRSDVARLLVEHGTDPFWHSSHGSILHAAAQGGIDWLVRDILDGGGDVNERDDEGETPLHEAAYGGQVSVCQLLIERGADVNARITGGTYIEYTPLQFAIEAGFPRITEILLRAGATASLSTASPLRNLLNLPRHKEKLWPEEIKQDILFLLLQENRQELNASRFATDPWVMSVRSFLQACSEVPARLKEQAQDHLPSLIKRNLYDAVVQSDEQEVRFLLTQFKERDLWEKVPEKEKGELLFAAAENGSIPIVQMLIEHGIDINTYDPEYGTALHEAIRHRRRELALWLIERGSDVNIWSEPEGQNFPHTPLELAAAGRGDEQLVRRLLEAGAAVQPSEELLQSHLERLEAIGFDTQGTDAETLMELGFYRSALDEASNPAVVRYLLEAGADPNIETEDTAENGGPLDTAVATGEDEVAQLLLEYGARFIAEDGAQACLALALMNENEALLRLLLAQGGHPEQTVGLPPVSSASVRALLAAEGIDAQQWSDSQAQSHEANTYLRYFCERGRADKVRNVLEQEGGTRGGTGGLKRPLERAVAGYRFGYCSLQDCLATLATLMDAGAEVDQKLQLEIAQDGFAEILRFLAERGVLAKDMLLKEVEHEPEGLLHEAAKKRQLEMVAFLLDELQCDVDATVARSRPYKGLAEVGSVLLMGANPCVTPLHLATKAGHTQMVRLLIDRGADINARDWEGKRPFDYAECKQVRDVLRQAGALRGREESLL